MKSIEINGWKFWNNDSGELCRSPLDNPEEASLVGPDAHPVAVRQIKEKLQKLEEQPLEYDVCIDGGFINDESFSEIEKAVALAEKTKLEDPEAIVTILFSVVSQ